MEQNKENRLDELFSQARNEPAKTSFKTIEGQFLKPNISAGSKTVGSKIVQFFNIKTIIIMSITSTVTIGIILFFNGFSGSSKVLSISEKPTTDSILIVAEQEKVINEYLEEVKHIAVVFKNDVTEENVSDDNKALNKMIEPAEIVKPVLSDTLKKKSKGFTISKRNQEILDTAYRFPNLGYEEITANNRQKIVMFGKVRKQKKKRVKPKKNTIVGVAGRNEWYQPDPKGFQFIPMGSYDRKGEMYSIQAFYMKQTEVTNLEYRTFLFDLLINGRKRDFLLAKPDQKMWNKEYNYSFNDPMVDEYFSHPAYDEYPAVGMSRKGAEMYCEWFTEELNKIRGIIVNDVRLPYYAEWEWAASGGQEKSPYPWGGPYIRNSEGCFLANFKPMKDNYIADGAFHTAKANSYNPNDFGLYCMSGNVAEMVNYKNGEIGTKGGSWSSIGQELQIIEGKDRFKGQATPSCNIGFRPVMTFLGRSSKSQLIGVLGPKPITIIPPGTVKIDYNLFFDEVEVTNAMWKEYLYWQAKTFGKTSNKYKQALPDTTIWKSKLGYTDAYVKHYFSHTAYLQYPVIGVSYEQAIAFCKWRTDRVKELFDIQKEKDKKSIFPKVFEYRLPTKAEWEKVARTGYDLKTLKKIEKKHKGQIRCNLKRGKGGNMGVAGKLNDNADITAPVYAYWPNKYGIFNLIGNIAEMVSEKDIAKGGAWIHNEEDVDVEKDFNYTKPTNWIGFRCIFEVKDAELLQEQLKNKNVNVKKGKE